MYFEKKINELVATSPLTVKKLKAIGIDTFFDLLNYFPFRYEDFTQNTVVGKVVDFKNQYTRRNFVIQKLMLESDGKLYEATWFNQTFLSRIFIKNAIVAISGNIKQVGSKNVIEPKEYEILTTFDLQLTNKKFKHTGRIVPVYSEKYGLSNRTIREKMHSLLLNIVQVREILPASILKNFKLIGEAMAYDQIHYPDSKETWKHAKNRLSFDELFTIQLSGEIIKRQWQEQKVAVNLEYKKFEDKIQTFIKSLPFPLTGAQKKVLLEIFSDVARKTPMNRLVQGDVGSGKTVLAVLAAYLNYLNGYKTLYMAPTEILATQHFLSFEKLFKLIKKKPKISLLTGSKKPDKSELDKADIVIGTHALIAKSANFKKVSLVIVDEQHKFGVAQRATLKEKGRNAHLLTMTATPIPRTVALTLYRELDLSVLDEMPANRLAIKSHYIPKFKRDGCYEWIKKQMEEYGTQTFVVCPFIEESTVETNKTVKAAKIEYEKLVKKFKGFNVGLLHGQHKAKEKDEIMKKFKDGDIDVLVATPVVEVGVDIPNATVMLIEGSERFGLAQLHQLRGRVGRGDKQSYCFLFTEIENPAVVGKLNVFANENSGFKLAEHDLAMRGAGDIYGTNQHGLSNLKIASLANLNLISATNAAVFEFLDNYKLEDYSELKKRLENYKISTISKD